MSQTLLNHTEAVTASHTFHPCPSTGAYMLKVREGIRVESALEHAVNLLACAKQAASLAANGRAPALTSLWNVIHLMETAEALIDAVMLGLPANDDDGGVSL